MTLDQLKIFLEVARQQHITRAAQQLNLTQSTVSGAIQALEERHGVRLFDRVGRGITLTRDGEMFRAAAEAVMASARNAEQMLDDLNGAAIGRIAIHTSQTIASRWLPQRLVAFHEAWPRIEISLQVGNTRQCVDAIRTGDADIAFIEAEVDEDFLIRRLVGADRLSLMAGNRHIWCKAPPAGLGDLFTTRWILREKGSGTRATFTDTLRENGFAPEKLDVFLELPSNEAVCAAVAGSALATVISRDVADPWISTGQMVELPMALPSRPFHMIRHQARHRSRALGLLEDSILPPDDPPKRRGG